MKNRSILKLICLAGTLFFVTNTFSQDAFVIPASIKAIGSAGVSLQVKDAYLLNPAAISGSNFSVGINYSNRYLLKDLSAASVYAIVPISSSRLIASYSQFGNSSYQENLAELGLAKAFSDNFSMGLLLHYLSFRMAESDLRPGMLTFTYGIQYRINNFGFGISAFNPYSLSVSSTDFHRKYPYDFRVGVHQAFQNKLVVSSQINYHEQYRFCTNWGIQYDLMERLILRAGVQTGQPEWCFGFGFLFGQYHADFAFSHHQYLGFSPSFTLYFQKP